MTIIPALILATFIYSLYTYICFNPSFKGSNLIIYLGLLCALLANSVWVLLAKNTSNNEQLIQYAMYWDILVVITTLFLPIILFDVTFSLLQIIGLIVTIVGLVLMKIVGI